MRNKSKFTMDPELEAIAGVLNPDEMQWVAEQLMLIARQLESSEPLGFSLERPSHGESYRWN